MMIGFGGSGMSSRAARRPAAGRARRAGRRGAVFEVARAFALTLAGVAGRADAVARLATPALGLTGAADTAVGEGFTVAGVTLVGGDAAGGTAIVTGAGGAAVACAGWLDGAATTPAGATVESSTASPSSPSMKGFAIQS